MEYIRDKYHFLNIGQAKYQGIADDAVQFTLEKQLKNRKNWAKFVEAFRTDVDVADNGWRGEYWGKMMRGACLIYQYCPDEELYDILEETVKDLLSAQDELGRISSYDVEHEFNGWDIWARKYVLTGMLHFTRICHSEELIQTILAAMLRHVKYITEKIGDGEGQTPICEASTHWGGINSCSILEAVLDLYKTTGEAFLFDFASYIIGTGGCKDGNVIEVALENKLRPHEYPVQKAYETLSFFEGVLAYYELTGEEKYFRAVRQFVDAVQKNEVTVVGSAGCKCEEFNYSAEVQTDYTENLMQETCVTVTWMRMLCKLYAFTGEKSYAEQIEISARNALYGSMNRNDLVQFSKERDEWLKIPLPFDSYSPLINHRRGRATGGLKFYTDGFFYGCCACIAAAGIALYPLFAVMKGEGALLVNALLPGTVTTDELTLSLEGDLLREKEMHLEISSHSMKEELVRIRIPAWCDGLSVSSDSIAAEEADGEILLRIPANINGEATLLADFTLREIRRNGRTALQYGPILLARDAYKEETGDLEEAVSLERNDESIPCGTILPPKDWEQVRILLQRKEGEPLLLTDYASCGSHWLDRNANVSVWMNIK